jgi:hypothetical protein
MRPHHSPPSLSSSGSSYSSAPTSDVAPSAPLRRPTTMVLSCPGLDWTGLDGTDKVTKGKQDEGESRAAWLALALLVGTWIRSARFATAATGLESNAPTPYYWIVDVSRARSPVTAMMVFSCLPITTSQPEYVLYSTVTPYPSPFLTFRSMIFGFILDACGERKVHDFHAIPPPKSSFWCVHSHNPKGNASSPTLFILLT